MLVTTRGLPHNDSSRKGLDRWKRLVGWSGKGESVSERLQAEQVFILGTVVCGPRNDAHQDGKRTTRVVFLP